MRIPASLTVDVVKVEMTIACFALLFLVATGQARAEVVPAPYNFSSYEVRVADDFCQGATPIFVDEIGSHEKGMVILGTYRGYAVILRPKVPPVIVENVLVIAVKTSVGDFLNDLRNVLTIARYDAGGTSSCSASSSSTYSRGKNVPMIDRIWPSLMYTPRRRTKPLNMRRALRRWIFFQRSLVS